MRPITTIVVSLAMALGAIGLAVAAPGAGDRELASAQVLASSGAVSISNSEAGQALFNADGVRPGQAVTGEVTIGNDGNRPGRFTVRVVDVVDTGAAPLSERVELVLLDDDAELRAATPAQFGELDLGVIAPGQSRDYRFVATLPSSAGNSFQGSGLSLGFEWHARPVTGDPGPTPTPSPPATPTPTTPTPTATPAPSTPRPPVAPPPVALADAMGLPAPTSCVKRGRMTLRLKAPAGGTVVAATVKVNGRTKAKLKGKKAAKPVSLRGLKKKTKLAVSVKASDRRTYSAARTYKACKR
jgi:spore coat-associated protein N